MTGIGRTCIGGCAAHVNRCNEAVESVRPRWPISLQERVAQARALGYDVQDCKRGNGRIAAVYGRVSGPKRAADRIYSLMNQRGLAAKAADTDYSADISIMADLEGRSGASGIGGRPGLKSLCLAIGEGLVDDLYLMFFDRLARARALDADLLVLCLKHGVRIVTADGQILDLAGHSIREIQFLQALM
jgi:DNA invertase Pin-like site-specific DNA recombinase